MNAKSLISSIALLSAAYLSTVNADTESPQNVIPSGQVSIDPAKASYPAVANDTSLRVVNNSSDPIYAIQKGVKYTVESHAYTDLDYGKGIVTLTTSKKEAVIKFVNFEGHSPRCPPGACLIVQ
ncbi:hypothetical protein [Pseudomonas sp. 13B_3.2_Bac1]|uniref:hypothetical protein n=1 Tax=Pseudomonas sp. 13B_3.2_Bac1 TaxID=2971623 RepID=UPI0021CADA01|nr:hypothetical protein [Pseudomonas sp. 13B_3.2_Bac1]MCU1770875.1 hypothetical protein [Pseudomonas sp. 13B_3.2_Bac1]